MQHWGAQEGQSECRSLHVGKDGNQMLPAARWQLQSPDLCASELSGRLQPEQYA